MDRAGASAGILAAAVVAGCGAAAVVAGCGATASPRPVSGAAVFARECSSCHSLIGSESLHRQGGDLLGYTLTRRQLVLRVRQMPVRDPLTAAELTAVVDYVYATQQRARAR
jgi:mono/diheme cytochrome c family protein